LTAHDFIVVIKEVNLILMFLILMEPMFATVCQKNNRMKV